MLHNIVRDLLYEKGHISLTRVLAATGFLVFILGSFYLIYRGITWGNYETFATWTGGGGAATQVVNKFINSKYNADRKSIKEERQP